MLYLILDTSTERSFVSLVKNEISLFKRELPFACGSSKYLMPCLSEGLRLHHLEAKDLDRIIVGIGPGSYTGIRVGVAIAKSLSFSCRIPLLGFCSLKGFAPVRDGFFAVLFDAKISGLYFIKGEKRGEEIRYLSSPKVCSFEEARESLKDVRCILSPNGRRIKEKIEGSNFQWMECYPSDLHILNVVRKENAMENFSLQNSLPIMYLRKTQAEIEKSISLSC